MASVVLSFEQAELLLKLKRCRKAVLEQTEGDMDG